MRRDIRRRERQQGSEVSQGPDVADRVSAVERRLAAVDEQLQKLRRDLSGPDGALALLVETKEMLQALTRLTAVDASELPYPYRLTVQRFHLRSQRGEDGLLQAIFRETGVKHRTFVELGCGFNGGNSGFLAEELGWKGLMVDGSQPIVRAMRRRLKPRGIKVRELWVSAEEIDLQLAEAGVTGEVDLLSIDIDGNDIWVWDAVTRVDPRIVAIEFNTAFGPSRSVAVPYDPQFRRDKGRVAGLYYGASLSALAAVGARKGYRLVATENVNAFFVRRDVARKLPETSPGIAWRLYDKDAPRIDAVGGDVFKAIEQAGLALEEVA